MARKPAVTRHITYTQAVCRCVDLKNGLIFGKKVNLQRIVKDKRKQLEKCRLVLEKDNIHVLQVEEVKYLQSFASQTEIEFLENAQILNTVELNIGKK